MNGWCEFIRVDAFCQEIRKHWEKFPKASAAIENNLLISLKNYICVNIFVLDAWVWNETINAAEQGAILYDNPRWPPTTADTKQLFSPNLGVICSLCGWRHSIYC